MSLEKYINLSDILTLEDDASAEYYELALDVSAMYTGHYVTSRARILNLKDTGKVIIDCWSDKLEENTIYRQGKLHGYNYRMKIFN